MPYDSLAEAREAGFPTTADGVELTKEQVNKLAEIYDAIKAQGNVENAMAVAWTAWKRVYRKEGDHWIKREEAQKQQQFFVHANIARTEEHDTILQTLNRWILRTNPETQEEEQVCYTLEAFEATVNKWNGVPIIFAKAHPDMDLFAEDMDKALKAINGSIIGKAKDARIDTTGHPKLMVKLPISDPELNNRTKQGELSVSSGFWGTRDEKGRVTSVVPQHILVFPELGGAQPVDHGSQMLNMEEETNTGKVISAENATELKGILDRFNEFWKKLTHGAKTGPEPSEHEEAKEKEKEESKEKVKNMAEAEQKDKPDPLAVANAKIVELTGEKEKLAAEITELTNAKTEQDAKIKELSEKLEAFLQKEKEAAEAQRNAHFEGLIQSHVPKGQADTEDKKKALRKEYDEDPVKLMDKLLNMKKEQGTQREGEEYANATGGEAARSVGRWNPETRKFEDTEGT